MLWSNKWLTDSGTVIAPDIGNCHNIVTLTAGILKPAEMAIAKQ
jgi:hypothetical protein